MHVTELSREELDELKYQYVDQLYDAGEYDDVIGIGYGEIVDALDIPDDIVFAHYDDIDFTEDDFFCNAK